MLRMASSIKRFENTDHASSYAKYRPSYEGSGLVPKILDYLWGGEKGRPSLAVDVGCGQGQIIPDLVDHFDRILGVDISQAQIDQANAENTHNNVQYQVSQAESLPVEDNSVDLITVGMALHWFDHPTFYKEVDRVLRPCGVIALAMQAFAPTIIDHPREEELSNIISKMVTTILEAGYWHDRDYLIVNKYTAPEIQIPYQDKTREESLSIVIENVTIQHFFSYLTTRSGIYKYLEEKSNNNEAPTLWDDTIKRFCEVYGDGDMESKISYKFELVLLLGRKP